MEKIIVNNIELIELDREIIEVDIEPIETDTRETPEVIEIEEPEVRIIEKETIIKEKPWKNGKDGKSPTKTELKKLIKEVFPEDKLIQKVIDKMPIQEVETIEIWEDRGGKFLKKWEKKMYLTSGIWPVMSTGVHDFLHLTDAPSSYEWQSWKVVKVKSDETGLEFWEVTWGDRYKTTSTTSHTIVSTGNLTFTVDSWLAYTALQDVIIVHDSSNHMHGQVVSYSGTTLVVDIQKKTGSGTYASWDINLDSIDSQAIWWQITGTLSNQTDLQTALDSKIDWTLTATRIPFAQDSNTLEDDANLVFDKTNDRLGVQVTPQVPVHWVSETGATINNVVTGSVSLVGETLPTAPSGSITAIAMPSGGSGGGISFTNQWSGGFYANGTVYTARIYPCLVVGSTYYKSTNYEEITNNDPNDWDYYDLSLWWGTVSISGETVEYFVEIDVNSGWFSAIWVFSGSGTTISSISGSDPTTAWGTTYTSSSGTAPDAPVSFDYLSEDMMYSGFYENGTYYQYELDTWKNIGGTNYVSGTPVSYAAYDNNMGNYFAWSMWWSLTGSYDGVILRRSTDWGSSWSYQNLGSTSSYVDDNFSDDGSGSMWGNTYWGGSSATFDFYPYWTATAPSGVSIYSSQGAVYSTTITDWNYYILKHNFSGATGKVLDSSLSYWQIFSGSFFYDNGYTSWGSGATVTPTSYWFTWTAKNRDYRAYWFNGTIYSQTPLTLSVTGSWSTPQSVSGSVTYPSGITSIKILRQINGGGYTVSKTLSSPNTSFTDDTTDTTWNGNTTITPNSVVPWTARFDKVLDSVTGEPHLALVEIAWSGTRYTKLSFGVAANKTSNPTYQAHLISTASTGYLSMVTNRLEISSSIGGTVNTMFGNANIINNANSSSTHFQVKGANDSSLINTRSDMDTVGFWQAIGSDQQTTVQIQPARSGDAGLVMIWHASQTDSSTAIRTQTSAGSYTGEITVGGWLRTSTGALTTPAQSCRSDTNTGRYFPTSDTIGDVTGGVERTRIDSSGRFWIWTTPSARLHVVSTTEQIRSGYDASNYFNVTTGSTGITVFDWVGTGAEFQFRDKLGIGASHTNNSLFNVYWVGATYTFVRTMSNVNVAHGMTSDFPTDVYAIDQMSETTKWGYYMTGIVDTGNENAMKLRGVLGSTTPTSAAVQIIWGKKNWTTTQNIGNTEKMFTFVKNNLDEVIIVYGNGDTKFNSGKILNNLPQNLKNYTVATLPTGVRWDIAYVTDALAPTFLTTVVWWGAVVCPVFYNGTNWVAH